MRWDYVVCLAMMVVFIVGLGVVGEKSFRNAPAYLIGALIGVALVCGMHMHYLAKHSRTPIAAERSVANAH